MRIAGQFRERERERESERERERENGCKRWGARVGNGGGGGGGTVTSFVRNKIKQSRVVLVPKA